MDEFVNDEHYKEKYLKYKNKYLLLKNNELDGGIGFFKSSKKLTSQELKKITDDINSLKLKDCKQILDRYIKNSNNDNIKIFDDIIKKLNKDIKNFISFQSLDFYKYTEFYDKNKIYDKEGNTKKIISIIQELKIGEILQFVKEKVNKFMALLDQCNIKGNIKGKCNKALFTDTINEIDVFLPLLYSEIDKHCTKK